MPTEPPGPHLAAPPPGTAPGTWHILVYGPSGEDFYAMWQADETWRLDIDWIASPEDLWREDFSYKGPENA